MKNLGVLFLLWLLLLPLVSSGQADYTVETIPDPKDAGTGYVVDPDGILSEGEVAELNTLIAGLEEQTTAQMAVVIVNSIGEENPKDFATRLFGFWGVGQAGNDNGLLILTVMDQRRTEFETGYGLEGVLPDAICYRIGMQELVPYFREEQYGQGLIAAVTRIREVLEDPEAAAEIRADPGPSSPTPLWLRFLPLLIYFGAGLLLTLGFLLWTLYTLFSKEEMYDKYLGLRKIYHFGWAIAFPLPYILLFLFLRYKLRWLRAYPRYSKINGQPLRRLPESEEDRFLKKGQITEEEIGSVDYDVWASEDGEEILILRYAARFSRYEKCPKCGYKTYYHAHTKTIKKATYSSSGKKEMLMLCKNCGYNKKTYTTIPRLQKQSSSSWASGSSSGGSWGGSSGGGSSSWGGGSSGGGGAGVSW